MAKGKAENNRRETLDTPMPRSLRSRRKGHPVEKMTDDHQDTGDVNTDDTLLQCQEPPVDEGDQHQCHQPVESPPPSSDQQSNENNGEPEITEMTPCDPKRQLVVILTDCGQENIQNELENLDKMSNECEPSASSNKHTVNAGIKPDVSEEQMCAEDNPGQEMETNQKVDEVHQMSKEPVVDGPAKKRRRMGMCQLSEKERSQFLVKSTNRVEIDVKHEKCTDMAKEENGPSSKGMSSHQETTEMMQQGDIKPEANQDNKDDGCREETKVEPAGARGTTMMCEPETHISEENGKEGLDTEITKHRPFEENEPQGKVNLGFNCLENRTEPGCLMTVPDAAVTVRESGPSLCKDSDQTSGIQPSDEELTRTETEENLTVSVCDEPSPNLNNGDLSLKPHSDAEQLLIRSETEVYDTATLPRVADTVGESQKESKTDQVEEEGPAQNVALSNEDENKHWIEHVPNNEVEATETKTHEQQVETMSADGNGNFNSGTDHTKDTAMEMALPLQETESKTTVERKDQAVGDNPDFSHSSFCDTAAETNCSSVGNGHVMNGAREQNGKSDSSTATMGPPQSADFIDLPGLCSLDYVSDSQLNTIAMTEQVVAAESGVCSELDEDGTDLIRGLIRELSALNRTVMATHRELENLRRRGKNSKNAIR